ncbi:MAG: hypothetical protein GDA54_05895 [Alphaproteobacteria bacterium GM7ARS4]|nr:hypothetical protein [Alphaproteobacteria bacterium GM7ARS4]
MTKIRQKTFRAMMCAWAVTLAIVAYASHGRAEVVLMGNEGWEVSMDGSVNAFAVYADSEDSANQVFRVQSGLLPAVFGFNVKAPRVGGLDSLARIGLYPHIHNYNRQKNKLGENNIGSSLDLREIFFSVSGDKGSLLVGKTLSLYQGKNILTDMTLFGVGAVDIGNTLSGSTSLGRIGYGYVYPNFNAAIRYRFPEWKNFNLTVGLYDPSAIRGNNTTRVTRQDTGNGLYRNVHTADVTVGGRTIDAGHNVILTDAQLTAYQAASETIQGQVVPVAGEFYSTAAGGFMQAYTETPTPRLEGELTHSYHNRRYGVMVDSWLSGMFQSAETDNGTTVDSWGIAGGAQANYRGVVLTGSGYWGRGLGSVLMLDTDALDITGGARRHYGFIAQATYDLGQELPQFKGFNVGASLGINFTSASKLEKAVSGTLSSTLNTDNDITIDDDVGYLDRIHRFNRLFDLMLWYNVNDHLRVGIEYGDQRTSDRSGSEVDTRIFSAGGFFFF